MFSTYRNLWSITTPPHMWSLPGCCIRGCWSPTAHISKTTNLC